VQSFRNHHRQSGFTLIEIMVVVIIIAVMSVAVVSSLNGNNDRAARLQANRFMAVVNEVRDEAIIAGDNFALIVDDKSGSYRFESARSAVATGEPKVLISPLGDITPFEARFEGTDLTYVISVDDEGQLQRVDKKGVNF